MTLFFKIEPHLSLKNAGYPHFSFWTSVAVDKIFLSRIEQNPRKKYLWIGGLCQNKRKFAHIVCIKMEVNSQRRKILFLTANMVAMTSRTINLLGGTVLQKSELPGLSWDAQDICAVAKRGIVLKLFINVVLWPWMVITTWNIWPSFLKSPLFLSHKNR